MSPQPLVVRWGASPYERPEGLALEAQTARGLGCRYRAEPQGAPVRVIADADVLMVTSLTPVGGAELDVARRCKLLLTTTSGHDHLDLGAAAERGVAVARMPLARRDAVAQTTVAMALGLSRGLPGLQHAARGGRWERPSLPRRGLALLGDEPVGLIGLGVIGTRVAGMLRSLGARVLGLPPGVEASSLPALLTRCRIVSLHCSHAPGAAPVLDAELLAGARPELLVVNTARGSVLDLDAARRRLDAGALGGLALDVFPVEPWPDLAGLASHPRVLVTPHAAGYHPRLHESIAHELQAALAAWTEGRAVPNLVA